MAGSCGTKSCEDTSSDGGRVPHPILSACASSWIALGALLWLLSSDRQSQSLAHSTGLGIERGVGGSRSFNPTYFQSSVPILRRAHLPSGQTGTRSFHAGTSSDEGDPSNSICCLMRKCVILDESTQQSFIVLGAAKAWLEGPFDVLRSVLGAVGQRFEGSRSAAERRQPTLGSRVNGSTGLKTRR